MKNTGILISQKTCSLSKILLVFLSLFATTGTMLNGAVVDLELVSLMRFDVNRQEDGSFGARYCIALLNHGPDRIGNSFPFLGDPVLVTFYLSRDDLLSNDDIIIAEGSPPLSMPPSEETVSILCTGASLRFPSDQLGEFYLFVCVKHVPDTYIDPEPSNDCSVFIGKVFVGKPQSAEKSHSLIFDGQNDFALIGETILPPFDFFEPEEGFTAEAWILPKEARGTIVADDGYAIYLESNSEAANNGVGLGVRLYASANSEISSQGMIEFRDVRLNEWNHVAVQFDRTSKRLNMAINGKLSQERVDIEFEDFRDEELILFSVGGTRASGGDYAGHIDEIRISDIVRYQDDFAPSPRFCPDQHTRALFHFDDPEGASVFFDSSGEPNFLTAVNGTRLAPPVRAGDELLRLTGPSWSSGIFSLSVPTVKGAKYCLEFLDDFQNRTWTRVIEVTGEGGKQIIQDTTATVPNRIYRVVCK